MFTLRDALPADCDAIAEMVRGLARDTGAAKVPKVSGETLRSYAFGDRPLLMLTVIDGDSGLTGCCIAAPTFSTWRGVQGLYIIDLYIVPTARSEGLGEKLLGYAARKGWQAGARFIRMEVNNNNARAQRFYRRLGFSCVDTDKFFVIETAALRALLQIGQ